MDSQTTVQSPMFNATEASHLNNSSFKDISLSSWIKPKHPTPNSQENGIGFTTDDTETSIFDAHKYFSESNDCKDQPSHDLLSVPRLPSVSSADGYGRIFRTRSFRATPTTSSEASWNSQTGLMANPRGAVGVVSLKNSSPDRRNKRWSAAKKWFSRRKCCCGDEKSVQVKEVKSELENRAPVVLISTKNTSNTKTSNLYTETTSGNLSRKCSTTDTILEFHHIKAMAPSPLRSLSSTEFCAVDAPRQHRIAASGRPFIDGAVGFTFPILNASSDEACKAAVKAIAARPIISHLEENSLEDFRPMHELPPVSIPASMENPINARLRFSPGTSIAWDDDDDVASDASSDLFEIESFSTQTAPYPMYRRRDSVDDDSTSNARRYASANGANSIHHSRRSLDDHSPPPPPPPSVAASECCPASEVGIEWSVTTAEGYDRAGATNLSVDCPASRPRPEEAGGGEGKRKSNGLMVMSCRQEKAVSVGPQAVKCAAEGPLHVGGRPPRGSKPPMGSSHTAARLSVAFAA